MQYGTTEGYNPLRKQIAARMKQAFMVDCDIDNITITSGSQQGLSMLAQIFINPGDVVLVESPTYLGASTPLSSANRNSSKYRRMKRALSRKN